MNEKELKDKCFLLPNIGTAQEFISELIEVLEKEHSKFSTHSMNEGALFLQGQKDMLGQIIILLKGEKQENEESYEEEFDEMMGNPMKQLDGLTPEK